MSRKPRRSRVAQLHADWIGMVQPEGLVVSIAVLEELELYVRQELGVQQALRALTPGDRLPDLDTLLHGILGWSPERVAPPDEALALHQRDMGVTVRPTAVGVDRKGEVQIVVSWLDAAPGEHPGDRWPASHAERFERLLRASGHPVGLLATPHEARLVYAPVGQAPGSLAFPIEALRSADGRLLVDALHMLLGKRALFAGRSEKRLAAVLRASRERQERVTEALAAQVEDALGVLLTGFDAADRRTRGALLREVSDEVLYEGLTTVLLRLVFLLYAEDYGLLPLQHELYADAYGLASLGEQLGRDAVAHGEAQSRRFSAWPRLLSLFRLVWGGGGHGHLVLPARQGDLFHPDRFPFL